ncbi:MAG: signal peptidase I [Alphaproteobacteria bacterium]|nr:signal peptidase I [Alphaproteobacteria bacterium]
MPKKNKSTLQHFSEILVIIFIAILVRSILFEPYVVPSSSMLPNLLIGDRVMVNKYLYGISNRSFPFSPNIFKDRVFTLKKPERGDIVVFETDRVYIKRLIGLPGDKIQMIAGSLYINDHKVVKTLTHPFEYDKEIKIPQYIETLPNHVTHTVLDFLVAGRFDNTKIYHVPENHYFFMGDNRDDSRDSRDLTGNIGFVHEKDLLGKVSRVFFSSKEISWYNIPNIILKIRPHRFFHSLL